MKKNQMLEKLIHGLFLILGLITVGCVLLITIYLVISGIPAILEIGLVDFLFGKEWARSGHLLRPCQNTVSYLLY